MDGRVGKELWMTYQDEHRHWSMVQVCSLEKVTFGLDMASWYKGIRAHAHGIIILELMGRMPAFLRED